MQGHLMQKSRTLVDKKWTKKIKYNKKLGESEKKSDKAHHLVSALGPRAPALRLSDLV